MRSCRNTLARFLAFKGLIALLLILSPALAGAEWIDLEGDSPFSVELIESDGARSVFAITVGGFEADKLTINGKTWYEITLPGESTQLEAGLPSLPDIRRALVIPDDRSMSVNLLESEYVDLPGMPVAPSKGNLPRSVDPATVPFSFDVFYQGGDFWPARVVQGEDPHIIRDLRGMVVDANIFQYSPENETLRVYTRLLVEVADAGPGQVNVLKRDRAFDKVDPQFDKLYATHFLNYGAGQRYVPVLEDGGLLIISYDAFASSMLPLLEWKLQKGLETKLVTLAETGGSFDQIKSYISGEFNEWAPSYVLLVGDIAQIPIGADSDPEYSTLLGSDAYPELFVGRFSAENTAQVDTQVERTIIYERDQVAGEVWPQYGMGVASNQGPGDDGEYDDEHEDVIRAKLLAYGYLGVDQIYDYTGTAAMVSAGLNEGRGIVNYTGHGSQTSWGSTGFSNTHVNALVNDNMLPFIISVACNNGTFTGTCFAEAWQRATNGGVPTGAIASYMSYISQSWDPPMCGQDGAIDLLVDDEMRTIGGLWFNGSCQMMDEYGAGGANEFLNWTIFGDPSIAVRTKTAATMALTHSGVLFIGMGEYEVATGAPGALCALYCDGVLYGTGLADGLGNATIIIPTPPAEPMTLTLTVTAYNKVTAQAAVEVLPPSGPYVVFESATVLDASGDGDGELDFGETVDLVVELENVGIDTASALSVTLSSTDEYIWIIEGSAGYPDIPAGGFAVGDVPFEVKALGGAPDGHVAQFMLQITGSSDSWTANFSLPIQAPSLSVVDFAIDDSLTGNSSGTADAGETFAVQLTLSNSGAADAVDLTGLLSTHHPEVDVISPYASCPLVPAGDDALIGYFQVQITELCYEPSIVVFELQITGPEGYMEELSFEIPVGGWFDDMEVDRGWTVGAAGDDASSGIWLRADPVGTEYNGNVVQMEDDHTLAPGTMCFVTGNAAVGASAGSNDVDGGKTTLLSPVFDLAEATDATVSYWRWYTNDVGNNPNEDYWEVSVTSDGSDWTQLEYTTVSNTSWQQFTFDLTDYITLSDNVQLRFVASDEISGSLVEAGVDDFLMDAAFSIQTAVDDGLVLPTKLLLGMNYPNPFNPKTTIKFDLPRTGKVDLAVYDVTGRRVATLLSGEVQAGSHEVVWQGRDDNGVAVASGVYFSRLLNEDETQTRKMLLLK